MKTFVLRRLIFMILSVIAATLIVFSMSRLQGRSALSVSCLRLYDAGAVGCVGQGSSAWTSPLPIQYFIWLGKALTGDFGKSLKSGYESTEMLRIFAPASLQLGLAAWVFVLITGVPLGVLSAVKPRFAVGLDRQDIRGVRAGAAAVLVRYTAHPHIRPCSLSGCRRGRGGTTTNRHCRVLATSYCQR